ncbi:dephospho-CoA kinase [Coxiella endosymbiont of Amblyomma nuttalli]|uniref:dephospho-CoA kinase n=1 Tax=Coxiella endosymbiont of Amblyomma nuttalli TaxID=2749996 RepID=UPI001BA7EB7D|nr:dephospho-CoA kinase [Coxiella endosymbiont of Amblyomma nuttalli]QTS83761.1 Dephospho-CoA kinase [Coxiella endosymbiont of Amblyomma nuttalli]
MLRIGLTGGLGSGKSTVANYFAALKVSVIDADKLASELTQPDQEAFKKIVGHFGKEILTNHGLLNRSKLRILVFRSLKERLWLENLLHPMIIAKMQESLKNLKIPYSILVVPLLAEFSQSINFLDRVLVIDAPESLQIQRVIARNKFSQKEIQLIMQSQSRRKKRLAIADDILTNDRDLMVLRESIFKLNVRYLKLAVEQYTQSAQ